MSYIASTMLRDDGATPKTCLKITSQALMRFLKQGEILTLTLHKVSKFTLRNFASPLRLQPEHLQPLQRVFMLLVSLRLYFGSFCMQVGVLHNQQFVINSSI